VAYEIAKALNYLHSKGVVHVRAGGGGGGWGGVGAWAGGCSGCAAYELPDEQAADTRPACLPLRCRWTSNLAM
jgi:hypothetical protein